MRESIAHGTIVCVVYSYAASATVRFHIASYNMECDVCRAYNGGYVYERQAKSAAKKHLKKHEEKGIK